MEGDIGHARGVATRVLASRLQALPRGTQKRLAELAKLSEQTLSRWRRGNGNPNLRQLEALASAMSVSLNYLLFKDSTEQPALPSPAPDARRLAERIERLRRRAEITNRELAEALRIAEQLEPQQKE
jgi:transcriptional regulator with XRE-family HTH domain